MDMRFADQEAAARPKKFPFRDLAAVIIAVMGVILANVGVVRALDVALDVVHR